MTDLFQKIQDSEELIEIPDGRIDDDMVAELNVKGGILNIDAPYLPDGGYNITLDGKAGVWQIDSDHVALNGKGDELRVGKITVQLKRDGETPGHVTIAIDGDNVLNRDIYLKDGEVVGTGTFVG